MNRKWKLCLIGLGITAGHTVLSLLLFFELWSLLESGKGFVLSGPIWKLIVHGAMAALSAPWAYIFKDQSVFIMFANGITWAIVIIGLAELIKKKKEATGGLTTN